MFLQTFNNVPGVFAVTFNNVPGVFAVTFNNVSGVFAATCAGCFWTHLIMCRVFLQ